MMERAKVRRSSGIGKQSFDSPASVAFANKMDMEKCNGKNDQKKMAQQLRSSRLSAGMSGRVQDIVATFPQGEPTQPSQLTYTEHANRTNCKVFSVSSAPITRGKKEEICHVGTEEDPGDGYEYVLAIVDRNTGIPIEFRPTTLMNFQPRFRPSEELLSGRKRKKEVDYSKDYSRRDNFVEDRRRLTAEFGSQKKNKMLESQIRRSINDETLKAMASTAFSSANINPMMGDHDQDKKETKSIGLLEKGTSNVLPVPNYDAQTPADVYKLTQFLPAQIDEFYKDIENEATKFFAERNNQQSLLQDGISPLVVKAIGNPLRYANPARRCALSLKLIGLSRLVKIMFRVKGHVAHLSSLELEEMNLPQRMFDHIRSEYLGEAKRMKGVMKMQVSAGQKHRALAHLLCMLLLFDEPEFILPLSPLVQELGATENIIRNLLTAMGCVITVADAAQALILNTVRLARLAGPPSKEPLMKILRGKPRGKNAAKAN